MATLEVSDIENKPGVYKHPETGEELEAKWHPKFGTAMADGFVRTAYVWDRPSGSSEQSVMTEVKLGASYQEKIDSRGNTYYVNDKNQRISKEQYQANKGA